MVPARNGNSDIDERGGKRTDSALDRGFVRR
jgi:hypothetical protein